MDQVEKMRWGLGLFDSEFYIDAILFLEDIDRPEVSPRWLWNNR